MRELALIYQMNHKNTLPKPKNGCLKLLTLTFLNKNIPLLFCERNFFTEIFACNDVRVQPLLGKTVGSLQRQLHSKQNANQFKPGYCLIDHSNVIHEPSNPTAKSRLPTGI